MDIFTRIVLPYAVVDGQSARNIIDLLRRRGIDPGQSFWVDMVDSGVVIEQSRAARPVPGECQFRRIRSAA